MTTEPDARGAYFDVTWVHVVEQDSARGAVFWPEDADIPLSRRPRERLVLHRDGSAEWLVPGADDRPAARGARWSRQDNGIVVRERSGREVLRITDVSSERLLARMP